MSTRALPGAELVEEGLADLREGRETTAALLVSVAATRLTAAGCVVEEPLEDPERRLYERLFEEESDAAHARYNALIRRLVSFERALECVAP